MLEFIQKEVWVTEEENIDRSRLFSFFLPNNRDAFLVVNRGGKYKELITYESLLQRKNLCSYVICNRDMFGEAYRFYDVLENRQWLLPVLNAEHELISFLRWNAQLGRPVFRMEDCGRAENILISGCDEINIRILKELDAVQIYKEKEVFLSGEGWELMLSLLGLSGSYQNEEHLPEKSQAVLIKPGGDVDLHTVESFVSTYALKERFLSKRIFVYGANLSGQMILSNLEFMGVHVHGIIDDECMEEKNFLIWPIVRTEDIASQPDVIVVCVRMLWSQIKERLQGACELFGYEDLFQWDELLNDKKYILLYESVHVLEEVKKEIALHGGEIVREAVVNNLSEEIIEELMDLEGNLVFAQQSVGFFKTDRYCSILARKLNRKIYRTLPYLARDIWAPQSTNPLVRIHNAGRQGRRFILYGVHEPYSSMWQKMFRYLELSFDSVVDDKPQEESGIKSVYDLMYEPADNVLVLLGFDAGKWHRSCENLASMGFSDRNVLGIYEFSELILDAVVDVQLGHAILYEKEKLEQYSGFHLTGAEGKDVYRIVTLGGSTTADTAYRGKSWPQCLFDELKHDREAVIYNAAVPGFNSCQELLKLLRDVCALRPDLVISFSGVNDLLASENSNPFLSDYLSSVWEKLPIRHWGGKDKQLPETEELKGFGFWYKMEEIMHSIASVFGFDFLCFAQPILYSQERLTQERRWAFERIEDRKSAIEFRKRAGEVREDWFIDLTDILDNYPEVFIDFMHVDEEGNRIIANHVYHQIFRDFETHTYVCWKK